MTLYQRLWGTTTETTLSPCELDFVEPTPERWAEFIGGDNLAARFQIKGNVKLGDDILVRLESGRIGRYHVYSCRPDFCQPSLSNVLAAGICYKETYEPVVVEPDVSNTLWDPAYPKFVDCGVRGLQPSNGGVPDLSSGFTRGSSKFWEVLTRNEAVGRRTSASRKTRFV